MKYKSMDLFLYAEMNGSTETDETGGYIVPDKDRPDDEIIAELKTEHPELFKDNPS